VIVSETSRVKVYDSFAKRQRNFKTPISPLLWRGKGEAKKSSFEIPLQTVANQQGKAFNNVPS